MADLAVDLEVMGSSSVPKAGRGAVQAAAAVQHNCKQRRANRCKRGCAQACGLLLRLWPQRVARLRSCFACARVDAVASGRVQQEPFSSTSFWRGLHFAVQKCLATRWILFIGSRSSLIAMDGSGC